MSEHKFKAGDKVGWEDKEGYIRVGTIETWLDKTEKWVIKTKKGVIVHRKEADLFPAGNLVDTEEATEEFRKKLDEGFFDKANEELSGEEIDRLLSLNTNKSDKEMLVEAGTKPIELTKEMLGIDQAVIAGRNKSIEDIKDYIAKELEAEYQRGFLDGAQQLSRQAEKARHNIIKCCLEDIMNTIDATPEELQKALEDL